MRPQFSEPEEGMMGEINMVPFIDIMLVLLIVFIITVPVMKHAINVQLPRATADKEIAEPQTVRLAVAADGGYFLGGEAVGDEQLIERLKAEAAREPQPDLHISGDRDVRYEDWFLNKHRMCRNDRVLQELAVPNLALKPVFSIIVSESRYGTWLCIIFTLTP